MRGDSPFGHAVALAVLDAVVETEGPGGQRTISIPGLYRLPGADPTWDTVLQPGELIVAVELPPLRAAARSVYRKVRERARSRSPLCRSRLARDVLVRTLTDLAEAT